MTVRGERLASRLVENPAPLNERPELTSFAGSMVDELSTMGQGLVIPALSGKIRKLFGFDFSGLPAELGEPKRIRAKSRKKRTSRKRTTVEGNTKKVL
jgi:hypothetical protein